MRRAAKVDANHGDIVKALRNYGASVQSLATVGSGVPDLLVGVDGRNVLLEVKDGSLVPSRRKLTPDEFAWHQSWRGEPVIVVYSATDALSKLAIDSREYQINTAELE